MANTFLFTFTLFRGVYESHSIKFFLCVDMSSISLDLIIHLVLVMRPLVCKFLQALLCEFSWWRNRNI